MSDSGVRNIKKIAATLIVVVLLLILGANEARWTQPPQEFQSPAADAVSGATSQAQQQLQPPAATSASAAGSPDGQAGEQESDALAEPALTDVPHAGQSDETPGDGQEDALSSEQQEDPAADDDAADTAGSAATVTPAAAPLPDGTKIAYITIDDGPSRSITPGILDLLALEGIHATFFVLPHDGVRDLYQRMLDEGHEIGNHSYTHSYSRLYNPDDLQTFRDDVNTARSFIWENFGYLTVTYRFPGGMMGRRASIVDPRRAILEDMGYSYFDWNIDTGDANSNQRDKSAAALTNNVLNNTRGRDRIIVLLHDTSDKTTSLEALPAIISGLREQGYVFDILRNYNEPHPSPATAPVPATPTSLT